MHSDGCQDTEHFLLHLLVLELIRIVDLFIFILKSLFIGFESGLLLEDLRRHNVMDASRVNSSIQKSANETDGMESVSVHGDILRFFLSRQEICVVALLHLQGEVLIQVGIIDRVDAINELLILVVRRVSQPI